MLKKTISTILATVLFTTTLAPNIAEAKYFNIKNPGTQQSASGDGSRSNGIEIIKHLGVNIDTSYVDTSNSSAGNTAQGSNGLSVAFAYLTPQKQFGVVVRENINLGTDSANDKKLYDDIGSSNYDNRVWRKALNDTGITKFYENAVDDFENSSIIKNSINISKEDISNNNVLTQVSDSANGSREFVAATLYVRWFYDVLTSRTTDSNLYLRQLPALEFYSGTSGPYVSWGDFFSSTKRLIPSSNESNRVSKNTERRKDLANNANKYIRSVLGVTGRQYSGTYLTSDPVYKNSDGFTSSVQSYTSNKKAFYEKSFEYRRYFDRGSSSNGDYFEIVYPVEYHKITNNSTEKPTGIKSSVEARTIFTDSAKTNVSKYEFDINISPLEAQTNNVETLSSPKEYTVDNKVSTASPSTEPPEDKVDVWQKVVSKKLEIRTRANELICTKYPTSNRETITIYPSEVGYRNLTGCTATLIVQYNTFCRFLESKEVYSYKYEWYDGQNSANNQTYEYRTIYNTLYGKPEVITSGLNKITEHYNNSRPRTIYKYTTLGLNDAPLTSTVKDTIIGPNGGDPVSPELTVTVNPPNALTVLEGGMFDINMEFDPNGIDIGRGSANTYVWIENLVIKPIVVTAQNGDVIYRKDTPLTNFSNTNLRETINAVTAKPTHVGKATVTVDYTYTLVEEVHGTRYETDEFGFTTSIDYIVRTDRTECKGTAKDYFNIYSLTATTTSS